MRTKLDISALLVLAVFGGGLFLVMGLPLEARLFPTVICSGAILICVVQMVLHRRDGKSFWPADFHMGVLSRDLVGLGWVSAFFAAAILLGLQWGLPLVIFSYMKSYAKVKWTRALFFAVIGWGILWAVKSLLQLPLYGGLVMERWY